MQVPKYSDLPSVEGMPHGCAWGVFDKDGKKDHVGTLNHLTPEVILEASKEIKTGKSISLDWPLHECDHPGFGRQTLQHELVSYKPHGYIAYDDKLNINTQSGSQWDGQRHFGHQTSELHYNGFSHDELIKNDHLGLQHWLERGGVVGRGVLLDHARWAERKGNPYKANTRHEIPLSELKEVASDQGVDFKEGDILIVRSGFVPWYQQATEEQRIETLQNSGPVVGVLVTEELLAWLWDSRFAAVAGDTVGFEVMPFGDTWLHIHGLAMWGLPIGELWDLEKLSQECERQKRWSFFLTSAPLNVAGGVASPPNALAIF